MMTSQPILVSHALCPYVQRAAIVLMEKDVAFERRDVDLKNKPAWFLAISPLGKTPVLLVDDGVIFESAVICEYLEELHAPRLHPELPLQRARHRSWIEFGSSMLNDIGGFYNASDSVALAVKARHLRTRLEQLEVILGDGTYFDGDRFSIVDAVYGPVFRYFDAFESIEDFGFFRGLPKVSAWRARLADRESVRKAVQEDYPVLLLAFLRDRPSALSRLMAAKAAA